MNAPEFKTLADPIFQSIFNKGEVNMNDETNAIDCQTGEERPTTPPTTIPSSLGQAVPIQGVSGNTYAPMDTTPQAGLDPIAILDDMMARFQISMRLMVTALQQTNTDQQTNLEEAVSTALEQADWFRHRVEDSVTDAIRETDFDYEIGNSVERYMRNELDINDHVDFNDLVNDRVDDLIDDIVSEKVEEAVEARLAELLEEKLANARITVNF
jgi:hypothetical protein